MRISDWSSDVCSSDLRGCDTRLELLRGSIELLAELHDVDAILTERRTDRRCRIGLACRNLQFDIGRNLLCHELKLHWGCERLMRAQNGRASGRERVCQYV